MGTGGHPVQLPNSSICWTFFACDNLQTDTSSAGSATVNLLQLPVAARFLAHFLELPGSQHCQKGDSGQEKPVICSSTRLLLSVSSKQFSSYVRICRSELLALVLAVNGCPGSERAKQEYVRPSWIQWNCFENAGWLELSSAQWFSSKGSFRSARNFHVFSHKHRKKKKVFFSYQRLVLQGGVWEVFTEITSGWQLSAL